MNIDIGSMKDKNYRKLTVSIVIPNWNGRGLLEMNLPYVVKAAKGSEIIVADDASNDDSVSFLRQKFPTVTVITHDIRTGFSGNVNRGVSHARGDIVVLLNTDVRPEAEFLDHLIACFSDPAVAAVGCLEKSHEDGKIVLRGRGIARWERGYFIHARGDIDRADTAWVSGGSSAYRKDVWDKVGGMDTRFNPFYWEDIDLSYRIKKAGYTVVFENKSIVHHYHEKGKIKTAFSKNEVQRIVYRNQFLFHWKHIPSATIWAEHMFWTPVRLFQAIVGGDFAMFQGFLLAIGRIFFV